MYLTMNRPADAVAHARKAVAANPDSPWVRATLLEALIQAGRSAEALKEGRAALLVAPDDPTLHKLTGVASYEKGRYKEARTHLERSLELFPEDASTHAVLGMTFAHLKDKGKAKGHAFRAVSLDPENAFVQRAQGDVFLQLKEWENAKRAYRRALELDPEDTYTHTNLGYALQESGDREAAIEHTVNAARLDPTNEVATGNVVHMGRAAVTGSGIFIYILFRLGILSRHEEWRPVLLVLLALGITGLLVYRKVQERKLPPVVREAMRTHRRLDGPLPTPVWVLLGVGGCVAAGGVAGRLVDGKSFETARDGLQLAIGVALVAAAAYFLRRRMRRRDLVENVGWSFALWAALAALATLVVVVLLADVASPGPTGTRGEALTGVLAAVPVAGVLAYIAWGKAPWRGAKL